MNNKIGFFEMIFFVLLFLKLIFGGITWLVVFMPLLVWLGITVFFASLN